ARHFSARGARALAVGDREGAFGAPAMAAARTRGRPALDKLSIEAAAPPDGCPPRDSQNAKAVPNVNFQPSLNTLSLSEPEKPSAETSKKSMKRNCPDNTSESCGER